ncbi:unnamed protein product [Pleuronectes platessa]|uniref:Uncharacterized protein n=1 Tax=Pleuronectes platessa TaxID=8262 RepID=A0A9N7W2S2_PLEPL|nr:unnamed protein product [Pleuronectes platessa]
MCSFEEKQVEAPPPPVPNLRSYSVSHRPLVARDVCVSPRLSGHSALLSVPGTRLTCPKVRRENRQFHRRGSGVVAVETAPGGGCVLLVLREVWSLNGFEPRVSLKETEQLKPPSPGRKRTLLGVSEGHNKKLIPPFTGPAAVEGSGVTSLSSCAQKAS